METILFIAPVVSLLALAFDAIKSYGINAADPGDARMVEISLAIKEGAMAFLKREYNLLSYFVVGLSACLALSHLAKPVLILQATAFAAGAFCSGLAGFFCMRVAAAVNVRTTAAARTSLSAALSIAFSGARVVGLGVFFGLKLLVYFLSINSRFIW